MAAPVRRIGNVNIQFTPVWDSVKANQLVIALQQAISAVNTQQSEIAALQAQDTASVAKHVLATETGLGPSHTVSGLEAGQVLIATSSSAADFGFLSFGQLAQTDPGTFAAAANGDVIQFVNGYWSAAPLEPFSVSPPSVNALLSWNEAAAAYAWAVPDASLNFTGSTLSV